MKNKYCNGCYTTNKRNIEIIVKDLEILSNGKVTPVPVSFLCKKCGSVMSQPEYKAFRKEQLGK